MRGHRAVAGGRACVRGVPFMATLAALRRPPVRKARNARMTARGRPKKLAIVAGMRRLLATLRTGQPWRSA
jgi:transposase